MDGNRLGKLTANQSVNERSKRQCRFLASLWILAPPLVVIMIFLSAGVGVIEIYRYAAFSVATISFAYCSRSLIRRQRRVREFGILYKRFEQCGQKSCAKRAAEKLGVEFDKKREYFVYCTICGIAWIGVACFVANSMTQNTIPLYWATLLSLLCTTIAGYLLSEDNKILPTVVEMAREDVFWPTLQTTTKSRNTI